MSKISSSLANTLIRNLTAYQYIVHENPKEVVDFHIAEVLTPQLPIPPLAEGIDPNDKPDLNELETSSVVASPTAMKSNQTPRSIGSKMSSPKSTTSKHSINKGRL